MGKASITIDVNGKWSGAAALQGAENALTSLNKAASSTAKGVAASLKGQEANYKRLSRMAASTSKSTTQNIAQIGDQLVVTGGKFYAYGEQMKAAGAAMTAAITAPMIGLAAYSGQAAVSYDTALANVRKVTNMTEGELQKLGQAAIDLSTTQPVDAQTILNIEAMGAQFGLADDQLQGFAKTVSGLDIATDMNAETAATQMAQFKNIVNMSDEDMGRYGSTIVDLGNNFSTTESKIGATALRFASAGKQAGLSEPQILALSAAMSSMGIEAEMGGSSLSQVFAIIGKSVADGGSRLEAFAKASGMSVDQFKQAWETDAMGAFQAILKGVENADDMNVALEAMGITSIRQSDVMRRLAGNTDLVSSALGHATTAWQENTALQAEVDQRNESMASRLQVLKNRIDAIAIQVGVPLVNALISALDAASPVIETMGDLARSFSEADKGTQQAVLGLAALVAAAGPVASTMGNLAQLFGGVTSGIGNVVRDYAAYADALRTTDGAQMRVYNSAKNSVNAMALTKNTAVKAAGSVENYVKVWEEHEAQSRRVPALEKKFESAMDSVATATDKNRTSRLRYASSVETALNKEQAALAQSSATLTSWQKGVKTTESVAKATEKAGTSFTGLAGKIGGAAKGIAGFAGSLLGAIGPQIALMAGIAAVTAVVGFYAQKAQEAAERQDRMNKASQTLADISASAADGAKAQANAVASMAGAGKEASEALGDLNEKTQESLTNYETSAATVDQYVQTIQNLTSQGQLNAYQQEQLKTAVKGYNDITGDSVEVTDAAKGALSKSTEELVKNAEAWKRNAEMQAYQQAALEYQKQAIKTDIERKQAREELTEVEKRHSELQKKILEGKLTQQEWEEMGKLATKSDELKSSIEELDNAHKSASKSAETATQKLALMSEEGQKLQQAFKDLHITGSLKASGIDVDAFKAKLVEAGVSSETLSQVGRANISALAKAFKGDTDQMIWALQNWNNVPIVNKDGTVTVNDASLMDANKNVYTWNEQGKLVDKNGTVAVDGTSLVDAQGHVWVWNGSEIVSKQAYANVNDTVLSTAQGHLYTWNGTELVDKDGKAVVKDTELLNAQGHVYVWNGSRLEDKSADATVDKESVDRAREAIQRYNDNPPQNHHATNTIDNIVNNITNFFTGGNGGKRAAGGIRTHADGGIRYHAGGSIVNAPRTGYPLDLVGEAGAEAIVPLTNRKYAMPFVKMIATETAESMYRRAMEPNPALSQPSSASAKAVPAVSSTTYNLYVNNARVNDTPEIRQTARKLIVDLVYTGRGF